MDFRRIIRLAFRGFGQNACIREGFIQQSTKLDESILFLTFATSMQS